MYQQKILFIHSFIFTACFLLIASCNSDKKEYPVLSTMHDEVMEVHDEVMPKISTIRKNVKKLRKLNDLKDIDQDDKEEIAKSINQLDKADEAMMTWMKEFDKPDYTKGDVAKSYYDDEMNKITKVSEMMLSSIDSAEALIKKLEN